MFSSGTGIYNMKQVHKLILLIAFLSTAAFFSCKDEITYSEVRANIFQNGKCHGSALSKSSLADSCFSYTFSSTLTIDFCVIGNCCPDSNRFTSGFSVSESEIVIRIKDIAPNLCKCICKYMIHAEIKELKNNQYTLKCIQEFTDHDEPLYLKSIVRR